ncbi:hypothetical protein RHPLAN_26560 [Rhodoplanes sp. Z2-YC6860]|nr:hypothetical protein RHPLAN_26560 [Rhodoplanes sp. Z2-YC6860]
MPTIVPAVHYVGFRDDRFWNAYRIWGGPRIIHRWWDKRAQREIGPDDIVIFAEGDWRQEPKPFNAPDITEIENAPSPLVPQSPRASARPDRRSCPDHRPAPLSSAAASTRGVSEQQAGNHAKNRNHS